MTLYGKKNALGRLAGFRSSGRFPHALLFTGDRGTGKKLLADYAAMLFLCEKNGETPCCSCGGCRRAEAHSHPDVIYVKPILEAAKAKTGYSMVDAVRDLIKNGYLKPNDGDVRVYIFAEAETMTPECQNALLKFIEEPLVFNRFIFTSASENTILQTIRSRVTKIAVDPPTEDECKTALAAHNIDVKTAAALSRRFCGNIGRCLDAYGDGDMLKLTENAGAVVAAFCEKSELKAAAALAAFESRDELKSALTVAAGIIRDALVAADGGKAAGTDFDLSKKLSSSMSKKRIFTAGEIIEKYIGLCELNPNVNITANAVCAELFGIFEQEGFIK